MKIKSYIILMGLLIGSHFIQAQPINGCNGCDTITARHRYYYYWGWYDTCDCYFNGHYTESRAGMQLVSYNTYSATALGCVKRYTPIPLRVKGLMAMVKKGTYSSITLEKLPENLYLYQLSNIDSSFCHVPNYVHDTMILLDSVRWDTVGKPHIMQVQLYANDNNHYGYCYAYDVLFDKPVMVDSTFYICGTGNSNRASSIDDPTHYYPINYYIETEYQTIMDYDRCMDSGSQKWQERLGDHYCWIDEHFPNVWGHFLPIVDNWELRAEPDSAHHGYILNGKYYPDQYPATIEAKNRSGYIFSHWNDNVTDNPRVITLTQDTAFVAYYRNAEQYTVLVNANNDEWGTVTGQGFYYENDRVTIQARVAAGYTTSHRFVSWNDGVTDNPRTFVVDRDTMFTAIFEEKPKYRVQGVSNNPEWGHVDGEGVFYEGTRAYLTAVPHDNCFFICWNDSITNIHRWVLHCDRDTTFTALFGHNESIDGVYNTVDFSITPNPARKKVMVECPERMTRIRMMDVNGKVLKEWKNVGHRASINVSAMPAGLYLINVLADRGSATRRLVVE